MPAYLKERANLDRRDCDTSSNVSRSLTGFEFKLLTVAPSIRLERARRRVAGLAETDPIGH